MSAEDEPLRVWVDQDLCTGDGLCAQYAPQVFEFDIDGLAYVKDAGGELLTAPGARTDVPAHLRLDVVDAARDCPGECIHVQRVTESEGADAAASGPSRPADEVGVSGPAREDVAQGAARPSEP